MMGPTALQSMRKLLVVTVLAAIVGLTFSESYGALKSNRTNGIVFARQSLSIAPRSAATAKAFAVDRQTVATPKMGQMLSVTPSGFGNTKVDIGGKKYTLQHAIERSMVVIRDHQGTLTIENLTSAPVKVEFEAPTVMVPDKSYLTSDLTRFLNELAKHDTIDQAVVWKEWDIQFASSLGFKRGELDPDLKYMQIGELRYGVDLAQMHRYRRLSQQLGAEGGPEAFIVQRIEAIAPEGSNAALPPIYILYSGKDRPIRFTGNEELGALGGAATAEWIFSGGLGKPVIAMMGNGNQSDFDAAMLTMVVKAHGSKDSVYLGNAFWNTYSFNPPESFWKEKEPSDILAREKGWGDLTVVIRSEHHTASYKFSRGAITVVTKTAEMLAKVVAAIREILDAYLVADRFTSREELASVLQERIERAVGNAYRTSREGHNSEPDPIRVKVMIDGETRSMNFADMTPKEGPSGPQRWAAVHILAAP